MGRNKNYGYLSGKKKKKGYEMNTKTVSSIARMLKQFNRLRVLYNIGIICSTAVHVAK